MFANYFIPLMNRPTRITRESSTLIDNIFSNNYNVNDHQVNVILKTDITDHYIIFHTLSVKLKKSYNDEHKLVRMIYSSRTQRYIEKVRILTGLLWNHISNAKHIFQNSVRYLKVYTTNAFL